MPETNPNGANATMPDPRQQLCWDFYIETVTSGFPNAKASALRAGYAEDTADQITVASWFIGRLEGLRRKKMSSKAERNLDKMLDTEWEREGKVIPDVMRIVADVSKVVVSKLGKDDGWSDRTEITAANGKDLPTPIIYVQRDRSNKESDTNDQQN